MGFLILGSSVDPQYPAYRGTYRRAPTYASSVPDEHPVNQAFHQYAEQGGELGLVPDLARARKLVALYAALEPAQRFEVVEIIEGQVAPASDGEMLGFDLSTGYYSLLSTALEILPNTSTISDNDTLWVLLPLLRLVREYFQPQLNKHGLFSSDEIAGYCLDCMMALQAVRPNLCENPSVSFRVLGLWRVT